MRTLQKAAHRATSVAGVDSPLVRAARPGSTCFDVGANVGVYALQFAHWTGAAGRVVAFGLGGSSRAGD
ncbi:hypothetical protein BH18ACI5_BH18ACI5_16260 [soil metagenome]